MKRFNFSPVTSTNLTHSCSIAGKVCIRRVVRMPSWAMGFLSLQLSELQAHFATPTILLMRNYLKVSRVYAGVVSAKMVKFLPNGNRGNKQFIGKAVGTYISPPPTLLCSKQPVASFKYAGSPKPTTIFSFLVYFLPKSFFYWSSFCIHKYIIPRITTNNKEAI